MFEMFPTNKGVSNEAFLVAVISAAKAKVVIDPDALAQKVGMSKGGAM